MQNTKKISAQIIADSVNTQGDRITTYILTFPRFILAELNTHRMFSRNSASSRAIPFDKVVKMVEEDPFIPIAWQKDHKGMQGVEYITGAKEIQYRNSVWLGARDCMIRKAKTLNDKCSYPNNDFDSSYEYGGVTKQLCNRLLEPFMWHTCLLTATEFENFFKQRCPQYIINWYPPHYPEALEPTEGTFKSKKDVLLHTGGQFEGWSEEQWQNVNIGQAEIHMQALAEAMWDAMNESTPKLLQPKEWHLPFGDKINEQEILNNWDQYTYADNMAIAETMSLIKRRVATACCARISYMTFDSEIDYKKDLKLHNDLQDNGHMSPFEHCARAMTLAEYETFVKGKLSLNEFLIEVDKKHAGWCNNFKGFIPYRYIIENKYESNTNF